MDLLIFHILMIPNKDASGSRDRCLPHYPPQCLGVCAEELWGRDCCVPKPGWYGFAHALETGQAMGWCTCANCCYVCYNATRYLLTFSTNRWFKSHNGIHRNNGAIACDTCEQFWWGRRAKNKQTTGVGKYLHGTSINFIFCHYFQENLNQRRFSKRRASTKSGLFALLSRNFEQILGHIVSLREKTLGNTNLVVPRHIKEKNTYVWLTSVAQKGRSLDSLLISNVRTVNGTPIMVITRVRFLLFLYKGHRGVIFQ